MPKNVERKETEFTGYISGDYECFCLCKVPFEEWINKQEELHNIPIEDKKAFWKWYKESEKLTLYPSIFFPKPCESGKWKFRIIVEAERIR